MVLIFIPQYLFHVTVHIDLTFGSLYHNPPPVVKYFDTGKAAIGKKKSNGAGKSRVVA
jgi:hypothetical protein